MDREWVEELRKHIRTEAECNCQNCKDFRGLLSHISSLEKRVEAQSRSICGIYSLCHNRQEVGMKAKILCIGNITPDGIPYGFIFDGDGKVPGITVTKNNEQLYGGWTALELQRLILEDKYKSIIDRLSARCESQSELLQEMKNQLCPHCGR